MLERGSYIPWASRLRRYLNRKRDNQSSFYKALDEGPMSFRILFLIGSTIPRWQIAKDLKVIIYCSMMLKWCKRRLQPEWLKYVTQVRLAKQLTVDSFDDLFDYLQQFEKLVNASRAKKLEKSHDPLALYQQDDVHNNSEDPLVSAMLLLAKAITQNFSNPTNNRLRASSNTRNQAIIQGDRVNIQSKNSGNTGRNGKRDYVQKEVVEGMNAPKETGNVQRSLRISSSVFHGTKMIARQKQDEADVIHTDEQNDFLFADASRMEEIKELGANICLMTSMHTAVLTLMMGKL
ncbi:hypothetical protein Tco_0268699 [Tanacetum coccineum]